jgi:flagellar motor switch protein FliN/FliY
LTILGEAGGRFRPMMFYSAARRDAGRKDSRAASCYRDLTMAALAPESLDEVLAACHAGLDQAAAALQRAFDERFQVQVGHSGPLDLAHIPSEMESAGLVMVLTAGQEAMLLLLPEFGNLLPEWYQSPDEAQTARLVDLAQELGSLWLPPLAVIEGVHSGYVPSIAEAVLRGATAPGAAHVRLHITNSSGQQGELSLVWPAQHPADVLNTALPTPTEPGAGVRIPAAAAAGNTGQHPQPTGLPSRPQEEAELPSYARSLLHIRVPVMVTLAAQRQPVARILEMGPGSLLQFEKSCEELLELEINGHRVAVGEAVKVGDKFGMRVSAMILPDERFVPVGRPQR